jgi:hypothetical protein
MNHNIAVGNQAIHHCGVRDVAHDKLEAVRRQPLKRGPVSRVSELVQDCHCVIRVIQDIVHKIGTDETGTAGHEEFLHVFHISITPPICLNPQ